MVLVQLQLSVEAELAPADLRTLMRLLQRMQHPALLIFEISCPAFPSNCLLFSSSSTDDDPSLPLKQFTVNNLKGLMYGLLSLANESSAFGTHFPKMSILVHCFDSSTVFNVLIFLVLWSVFKFPICMCIALVSSIIKATVSAPCEPCISGVLHYCSHVYVNLFSTNWLIDWLIKQGCTLCGVHVWVELSWVELGRGLGIWFFISRMCCVGLGTVVKFSNKKA